MVGTKGVLFGRGPMPLLWLRQSIVRFPHYPLYSSYIHCSTLDPHQTCHRSFNRLKPQPKQDLNPNLPQISLYFRHHHKLPSGQPCATTPSPCTTASSPTGPPSSHVLATRQARIPPCLRTKGGGTWTRTRISKGRVGRVSR